MTADPYMTEARALLGLRVHPNEREACARDVAVALRERERAAERRVWQRVLEIAKANGVDPRHWDGIFHAGNAASDSMTGRQLLSLHDILLAARRGAQRGEVRCSVCGAAGDLMHSRTVYGHVCVDSDACDERAAERGMADG